MHLLVMAKEPVPGRVKTRLCPPCTPAEAAAVAEATLADTLTAVAACGADRRILALDGRPGPWLPAGFEVLAQHGEGLGARLGAAWEATGGPGLQIGMDTPQLSPAALDAALAALDGAPGAYPAVLGPACDGGWWGLGLRHPGPGRCYPELFAGVPMSTGGTLEAQRRRLDELGLTVTELGVLRDVDTAGDLVEVAAAMPGGATPAVVAGLRSLDGLVAPAGVVAMPTAVGSRPCG